MALIAVLASAPHAWALDQNASAPALKAAFILNFAKFTEWPALDDGTLVVCVASDEPVATALQDLRSTATLDSRTVKIRLLPSSDHALNGCQIVFIGSQNPRLASALLEEAARGAILTVSDAARFAEWGGMIELFIEKDRMRFAVNVDAVTRSKLRLSSRVLGLAKIVRDTGGR